MKYEVTFNDNTTKIAHAINIAVVVTQLIEWGYELDNVISIVLIN